MSRQSATSAGSSLPGVRRRVIIENNGFPPYCPCSTRQRRGFPLPEGPAMAEHTDRRSFMGSAMIGAAGAGAMLSLEEKSLKAATDQRTAPSPRPHYLGETLPQG